MSEHPSADRPLLLPIKIYVAMICDRHTDPEPHLFSTPEAAIDFARGEAQHNARSNEDVEEHAAPEGWLYYATYSGESDSVWVLEKALDGSAPNG